jgi:cytidylate kinase
MNGKKLTKSILLSVMAFAIISTIITTCDMTYILDHQKKDFSDGRVLTETERDELEKTGRFLKIINMPHNTQIPNVSSVQVANSASVIAKLDSNKFVCVFVEQDTSIVYLPLVYNNNTEFLETGFFYTAFTIHVDAVTKYIVEISDKLLVSFTNGRGTVDILSLPEKESDPEDPSGTQVLTEIERDELEKTGRFLKLINMPHNTQIPNVFSVQIANSASVIAKLDNDKFVCVFVEQDTSTVYLPLAYNDNTEFLETGFFYTAFTIHVDAITKYIVEIPDKLLIFFMNGRGTVDVNTLGEESDPENPSGTQVLTEIEKDELERTGHFLKLTHMPLNTQISNVFSVQIANSASVIAKLDSNKSVCVFKEQNSSTVYLPLAYNDNTEFLESGSFYTAFTIHIDAVTSYIVNVSDKLLVSFTDGRGTVDIRYLPEKENDPENPAENEILTETERDELENTGRFLKLTHMPLNTQTSNVFSVQIANSASAIAKLDNINSIRIFREQDSNTVYLPLARNDNTEFLETGYFYAAFTIHIDAVTSYIVNVSDKLLVSFTDGRGMVDINLLPGRVLSTDPRYLTFLNLPGHVSIHNISNVLVHNQATIVASCKDYSLTNILVNDNKAVARIPLEYHNLTSVFTETGAFYVSFDINVDAQTRYLITKDDQVLVSFTDGRGTLDILSLPEKEIDPENPAENEILTETEKEELEKNGHFLKLTHMPLNTQSSNVFSVQIANSSSTIGKLDENKSVSIFREQNSSAVYLPLSYHNNMEFLETGLFYAAFTIHIDAVTSYIVNVSDKLLVSFSDGRGTVDINSLPEKETNPDNPGEKEILTEPERNELERTGHFLKLTHMPLNTQSSNVFSVQIANSASVIAKLDESNVIRIFKEQEANTVYLPLVYNADNTEFLETGFFYLAFTIHIDAVTSFIVEISDKLLISFSNGRGEADIRYLPEKDIPPEPRYLTILNIPVNFSVHNISNVLVHNQATIVASCKDYSLVEIFINNNNAAAKIPLEYNNLSSVFTETGFYYVSFDINVDVQTRYLITKDDHVLVSFTDGNGTADILSLPEKVPSPEPRYLTILNLPENFSLYNISNVLVHNQATTVASCKDYSHIEVSYNDNKAVAKIPLEYHNLSSIFTETGAFYVSFDINVDVQTRYLLTKNDKVLISFIEGNGFLDILNIPENIIPYFTIQGLPFYLTTKQISDVNVYNLVGTVASCNNYNDIILFKENGYTTARIPLSYSSGDGYFMDTGRFVITFTVNVDIDTQIVFSRTQNITLPFTEGSALLNLQSTFGHFEAELTNPTNTAAPIIKAGSSFDIDGFRHTVPNNLTITSLLPAKSSVLYLYAFRLGTEIFYEYSTDTPIFNTAKNGFYKGQSRALWKMLYIYEENQFFFKTYIDDEFPQFGKTAVPNLTYNSIINAKPVVVSLSGSSNAGSSSITLQPGIYAVKLNGAGGGGGYGAVKGTDVSGSSAGGAGGSVFEILTIKEETAFTAFTGTGGSAAPAPATSGTFQIYYTKNTFNIQFVSGSQYETVYSASVINTTIPVGSVIKNDVFLSGGGGGGGGSGTFLYSDKGYFLSAAGGGGGSGGSQITSGGAGGYGGIIGPGAGGGAAGFLSQSSSLSSLSDVSFLTASAAGGAGGGPSGGNGGAASTAASRNGSNGLPILYTNSDSAKSVGGNSRNTSAFNIPPSLIGNMSLSSNAAGSGITLNGQMSGKSISNNVTNYSFGDSGDGGSVGTVHYASGPQAWLNTNNAEGAGAAVPELLSDPVIAGAFTPSNATNMTNSTYYWFGTTNPTFTTTLSIEIAPSDGINGSPGGNNRNSTRGGGSAGGSVTNNLPADGSAGSITIIKIWESLTK